MIRYRFPFLLAICLGYLGLVPNEIPLSRLTSLDSKTSITFSLAANAQEESPTTNSDYDRYMKEGYQATEKRDYKMALEKFNNALAERPEDSYAKDAISNVEGYIAQQNPLSNNTNTNQSNPNPLPGNSLWLIVGVIFLSLAMLGAFVSFLTIFGKGKEPKKEKPGNYAANSPTSSYKSPSEPEVSPPEVEKSPEVHSSSANPYTDSADQWREEKVVEADLPVQSTTRMPSLDIIDELLKNLQDPDTKNRRKAIWKLAQISDSRAMKPLVDLMIQTDSYERSLILEALSQVCSRTLRPMNQALAVSLQDKNSQVRKNAIRDLTRLYDLMSQISELLCYALDDDSIEVQETAKWALEKLNLRMPIKLNLGTMDDDDDSVFEDDEVEDAEFEEKDINSFKR
jgi:hypothetical protein